MNVQIPTRDSWDKALKQKVDNFNSVPVGKSPRKIPDSSSSIIIGKSNAPLQRRPPANNQNSAQKGIMRLSVPGVEEETNTYSEVSNS